MTTWRDLSPGDHRASIEYPHGHRPLPSVVSQYPSDLVLGRGMAPGGYDTCYRDCEMCKDVPLKLREDVEFFDGTDGRV